MKHLFKPIKKFETDKIELFLVKLLGSKKVIYESGYAVTTYWFNGKLYLTDFTKV